MQAGLTRLAQPCAGNEWEAGSSAVSSLAAAVGERVSPIADLEDAATHVAGVAFEKPLDVDAVDRDPAVQAVVRAERLGAAQAPRADTAFPRPQQLREPPRGAADERRRRQELGDVGDDGNLDGELEHRVH